MINKVCNKFNTVYKQNKHLNKLPVSYVFSKIYNILIKHKPSKQNMLYLVNNIS